MNGTGLDRFGRHGVESDVTAPFLYLLFLRTGNRYNVNLNGTNRAQTNGAILERFRLHGVESDVTVRKKIIFVI